MSLEKLSKNLFLLMTNENVSKRALAKAIEIDRKSILNYCDGLWYPRYDTLAKLADYFEVSADFLLGLADEDYAIWHTECSIDDIPTHFVSRVNDLMRQKSISQYRLAKLLETSQTTVSKWLHLRGMPETGYLIKLAKALDCSVDYLLSRSHTNQQS